MNAAPTTPFALWLVPAEPWRERWGTLIDALAASCGGTRFEPHITLHVGTVVPQAGWESALSRVACATPAPTLVAGTTRHSEEHFRTLYVDFDDDRLHGLRRTLLDAVDAGGDYTLRGHLSLLYRGGLDPAVRAFLAGLHRFEGEPVRFDELVIVRPGPQGTLADIGSLDTRARSRLSG